MNVDGCFLSLSKESQFYNDFYKKNHCPSAFYWTFHMWKSDTSLHIHRSLFILHKLKWTEVLSDI